MTKTTVMATTSARRVRMVMLGMLVSLLAVLSLAASAQPAPPSPGMMDGGGWGHMHHGGGTGGGMMFGGSPERMGRMIDHMLDGLNANDAQRTQIKQIAAGAGADLKTQMEAGRALRQRALQAFTAPTVDAATVEQVRAQMLQLHEQTSRRMTQAMLDIARVLTPEQRAKIGERMRDWQSRMDERRQREQREPPRR
jgi:Spy/CpxP family protein refolding chaperone